VTPGDMTSPCATSHHSNRSTTRETNAAGKRARPRQGRSATRRWNVGFRPALPTAGQGVAQRFHNCPIVEFPGGPSGLSAAGRAVQAASPTSDDCFPSPNGIRIGRFQSDALDSRLSRISNTQHRAHV
jgi:hypothetical protein